LDKQLLSEGDFMKRTMATFTCLVLFSLSALAQTPARKNSNPANTKAKDRFDPSRNARKEIADAVARAQKTHKRILLDVGGEWCVWCHRLDDYFAQNAKLNELREENFIWLKINFSPENENREVLSAYPEIKGYPHIFVLDENGRLLHSQNTGELEAGNSYDFEKMLSFLKQWSAHKQP
jgi:thiol:disulfide interchange protein